MDDIVRPYMENGRLPGDLWPQHYVVSLQPDIYQPDGPPFPYYGHVDIRVQSDAPTGRIVLNSVGLTIDEESVVVQEAGGTEALPIGAIELEPELDFLIIYLDDVELLPDVQYNVHINFSGTLRTPLQGNGLYYDIYEQDGETRSVHRSHM